MKNITLSADERLIDRAREIARRQGTSLNQLIRDYLESLVGRASASDPATELFARMDEHPGDSGGVTFRREDLYSDRT